ncbi:MAG: gliding motility-associated C-terminal domain-containing protein [Brumimicrobium sp.]|nr:gliding motility-associated C-terminal domain-containing protein [Brumimicrobium sp.]
MITLKKLILLLLLLISGNISYATHGMGGEITWTCQGGGNYVFELIFYRDCNGFEVNTTSEELRVWGHPNVTTVSVDFIDRIDISPFCTAAGGVNPLACGTGVGGGNGVGAVEKIIYRSAPVSLSGIPPASGWHFTYESFSRSGALTNIVNPTNYGITLTASMFPSPGQTTGCIDNSPRFLQEPYMVSCAGETYNYNPHGVDVDLDSLVFDWAVPYDHFPVGVYNPPTNPQPVPFETGFSYNNPTPDASFDPGNVPASINNSNGAISFLSNTQGNFVAKVKIDAFRNGVKIASVQRESQFIVLNCSGTNTTPTITPPFAGGTSFETTIFAGDPVSFNMVSTDNENLQDGTPQSNILTTTGLMYGSNFTNAGAGCAVTPCATLNSTPPITGINGVNAQFNWQTSCDHLIDATGQVKDEVPYIFVFKIQDDYCQVPKVRYATVTIRLQNKTVLPAPEITCITTAANGDVTINWTPITDPSGDFASYELFSVGGGSLGTINNINSSSFTVPAAGNSQNDYYLATNSGCNGNTARYSDTVSNIFLNLNNPGNGRAELSWNRPHNPALSTYNDYFHIYREYPAGIWTLYDSVPYSSTNYFDTITICQTFLNYQIVLPTTMGCSFESNIEGDVFEDQIVPDIPVIQSVSIDTTNNGLTITWNENDQSDTYGYVIYQTDANGNLVEIDTVWGIGSTSYTHFPDINSGPFEYSVAAFDSCFTANIPPTYQTSAKGDPHTSNFLTSGINVCQRTANLNWTGYVGFGPNTTYNIYARINNASWQLMGTTPNNAYSMNINMGDELIIVIEAVDPSNGVKAFSNKDTLQFTDAGGPSISYLSVATVAEDNVIVKHRLSLDGGIAQVNLWKFNTRTNNFEMIDDQPVGSQNEIIFEDPNVEVDRNSYRYKTEIVDTCGISLGFSNIGQTIHLNVITDNENLVHILQWTPYDEFIGNIKAYRVYRSVYGAYNPTPIAVLQPNVRSLVDSVEIFADSDDGRICYFVEAVEGPNQTGISEVSRSNEVCPVIPPTIYIPNAFSVGGNNPVFRPVLQQFQVTDYRFEIFDRYGRSIFETTDPQEGWNGEIKGTSLIAREGVYIYRLSLRDGNGIEVLKHGHVTLLDYTGVE